MATALDNRESMAENAKKFRKVLGEVLDLVRSHCEEDRRAFEHLFYSAVRAESVEDREEAVVSMVEILNDGPDGKVNIHRFDLGGAGDAVPRASSLRKWNEFVSKKIQRLRGERGWSQQQLAEATGLTQSHISRIESGVHSPTYKTLAKIAQSLGVSISELDPV